MRDLLIITPSRGRPENVSRLVQAVAATSIRETDIQFGFDDDDPLLNDNIAAALAADRYMEPWRVQPMVGRRKQLGPWTNEIAMMSVGRYRALASLGDDHEPVTFGWDAALLDILAVRPGFACPNGIRRVEYPEAVVISSPVVAALGWMCEPSLQHYCVDQVWLELAQAAGCWTYRPDVIIEHKPVTGDATHAGNLPHINPDALAWRTWQAERKAADVATVRKAIG